MLDMNKNIKLKKKKQTGTCNEIVDNDKCLGKYHLNYEDGAPVFICIRCGRKELTWKKFYDQYLQLYKVKENWDKEKDKISCIIGFFCFKYYEFYQTKYVFVPTNTNPYSSKECRDAWTLLAAFNGDANKVRRYIVWLFKNIIGKHTTITSFGYLNTPNLIRKYNLHNVRKDILRRESKLPDNLIIWCHKNTPGIIKNYSMETMNDLGALLSHCNAYNLEDDSEEKCFIREAVRLNLIQNNKLNIG